MPVTIGGLERAGAQRLAHCSPTPGLDAALLLAFVLGRPRIALIAHATDPVAPADERHFLDLIERRVRHEPVAYLTGRKEFFGREFAVTPAVLIPRPESELLVERAMEILAGRTDAVVIDLGTGSGCLAISIALECAARGAPVRMIASDVCAAALEIARTNARNLGASVEFRAGRWLEVAGVGERFDLIVANPPYIEPGDRRVSPELAFEPPGALYAGDAGCADLLAIMAAAPAHLQPGGSVLLEIGAGQGEELRTRAPFPVEIRRDLADRERLLEGRPQSPR